MDARARGTIPMRHKMMVRLLAVVFLTLGILGATAQTSRADINICKDPPRASMPDKGAPGWLGGAPNWDKVPAVAPDPFADKSKAAIADVYGYNFEWQVYDLGCGNDLLRDPQAVSETATANLLMQWPSAWTAIESRLHSLVSASPMKWVQDMIAKVNGDVAAKLWNLWFPVTVIAAGAWVVARSRRAAYSESAAAVGVIIIVAAASVFMLNYPTKASKAMDDIATGATSIASAPFSGTGSSDAIVRNVLYPQWLQGQFGSSTSPTATKYGPGMFWATHYTWSEYKQVQQNPQNLKIIDNRKGDKYQQIVKEIQTNDPVAYLSVTGKDSGPRIGAAIMAYPFTLVATIFMMITLLMLAVAKAMLQAFVVAAPVIGIFGAHPKGRGLLISVWDLFTAAIMAAVKFAFLGGLFALFLGSVLGSGANPVEQLFWLVIITIIAFAIGRPFRTLKTMTPGLNPNRSYLRDAMSLVSSFAGAKTGAQLGNRQQQSADTEPASPQNTAPGVPAENARRTEDESLAPLPAPPSRERPQLETTRIPAGQASQAGGGETVYTVSQVFNDDEDAAGHGQGSSEAAPLPPAPHRSERELIAGPVGAKTQPEGWQVEAGPAYTPRRALPTGAESARSVAPQARSAAEQATITTGPARLDQTGRPPADADWTRTRIVGEGTSAAPPSDPSPSADHQAPVSEQPAQPPVVVAGPVLAEDDGLYRSGDDPSRETVELRPAEVQLDQDGNETYVIYRSSEHRYA